MSGLRRIRLLPSLRSRVTAIALLAVTVAFAAAGTVLVAAVDRDARAGVDRDLESRVSSALGTQSVGSPARVGKLPPGAAAKLAHLPPEQRRQARAKLATAARPAARKRPGGPFVKPNLLLGNGTFARVIVNGQIVKQVGDFGLAPLPTTTGFQTVDGPGGSLRTLTVYQGGAILQVGESLPPALARAASTRRVIILAGVIGLAATGAVVWLLTGLALRPVRRLQRGAEQVSTARDLDVRLSEGRGPSEVDALARTLNGMLTRLAASIRETEQALAATRRFAADAGHEIRTPLTSAQANLEVLRRHPDMPGHERERIVAQIAAEQRRLVSLLDSLQALARGDAAGERPEERFDLADLLDAGVHAARRRHPLLRVRVNECPDQAELRGWPDGVRSIVDNLLQNAACHAGSRARVELALCRRGHRLVLTVDDDGPGVPEAERQRIFERFFRGAAAVVPGSGLGLAVVAQQVLLHDGEVVVVDSPLGGARFQVSVPALVQSNDGTTTTREAADVDAACSGSAATGVGFTSADASGSRASRLKMSGSQD